MNAATRLRKIKFRKNINYTFVTAFATACLAIFLVPFLYMIFTSLKTHAQMIAMNAPLYPAAFPSFVFKGQNTGTYNFQVTRSGQISTFTLNMKDYIGQTMDIFTVPLANGTKKNLAVVIGFQQQAIFIDPAHPAAAPILWSGSYFKALPRACGSRQTSHACSGTLFSMRLPRPLACCSRASW
jgi:hypothetical protein